MAAIPGLIIVVRFSSSFRSRKAATRTTSARQVTGSHPRLSLNVNTAVSIDNAIPKTSIAATDCSTRPSKDSSQFMPHWRDRPGTMNKQAKITPTTSRRRHPTKAIKAVVAKPIVRKANIAAATAATTSTPTRPKGFSPFAHFTVGASPLPSPFVTCSLM